MPVKKQTKKPIFKTRQKGPRNPSSADINNIENAMILFNDVQQYTQQFIMPNDDCDVEYIAERFKKWLKNLHKKAVGAK